MDGDRLSAYQDKSRLRSRALQLRLDDGVHQRHGPDHVLDNVHGDGGALQTPEAVLVAEGTPEELPVKLAYAQRRDPRALDAAVDAADEVALTVRGGSDQPKLVGSFERGAAKGVGVGEPLGSQQPHPQHLAVGQVQVARVLGKGTRGEPGQQAVVGGAVGREQDVAVEVDAEVLEVPDEVVDHVRVVEDRPRTLGRPVSLRVRAGGPAGGGDEAGEAPEVAGGDVGHAGNKVLRGDRGSRRTEVAASPFSSIISTLQRLPALTSCPAALAGGEASGVKSPRSDSMSSLWSETLALPPCVKGVAAFTVAASATSSEPFDNLAIRSSLIARKSSSDGFTAPPPEAGGLPAAGFPSLAELGPAAVEPPDAPASRDVGASMAVVFSFDASLRTTVLECPGESVPPVVGSPAAAAGGVAEAPVPALPWPRETDDRCSFRALSLFSSFSIPTLTFVSGSLPRRQLSRSQTGRCRERRTVSAVADGSAGWSAVSSAAGGASAVISGGLGEASEGCVGGSWGARVVTEVDSAGAPSEEGAVVVELTGSLSSVALSGTFWGASPWEPDWAVPLGSQAASPSGACSASKALATVSATLPSVKSSASLEERRLNKLRKNPRLNRPVNLPLEPRETVPSRFVRNGDGFISLGVGVTGAALSGRVGAVRAEEIRQRKLADDAAVVQLVQYRIGDLLGATDNVTPDGLGVELRCLGRIDATKEPHDPPPSATIGATDGPLKVDQNLRNVKVLSVRGLVLLNGRTAGGTRGVLEQPRLEAGEVEDVAAVDAPGGVVELLTADDAAAVALLLGLGRPGVALLEGLDDAAVLHEHLAAVRDVLEDVENVEEHVGRHVAGVVQVVRELEEEHDRGLVLQAAVVEKVEHVDQVAEHAKEADEGHAEDLENHPQGEGVAPVQVPRQGVDQVAVGHRERVDEAREPHDREVAGDVHLEGVGEPGVEQGVEALERHEGGEPRLREHDEEHRVQQVVARRLLELLGLQLGELPEEEVDRDLAAEGEEHEEVVVQDGYAGLVVHEVDHHLVEAAGLERHVADAAREEQVAHDDVALPDIIPRLRHCLARCGEKQSGLTRVPSRWEVA
ncbi:kxYKxGKxW signal peptide domain protein [Babesia caballi]|uniref:KxYKxGKxW signal peptide domain protein n=1 Tax=Babesia caballi TaxID=5871 RepID=A0AAV4LSR1_BABCB|nr:kxYKxGKxW signal peptide domain protein [Babesia caballi]